MQKHNNKSIVHSPTFVWGGRDEIQSENWDSKAVHAIAKPVHMKAVILRAVFTFHFRLNLQIFLVSITEIGETARERKFEGVGVYIAKNKTKVMLYTSYNTCLFFFSLVHEESEFFFGEGFRRVCMSSKNQAEKIRHIFLSHCL